MNASAARVVTGERRSVRAAAHAGRPADRDAAGKAIVRGLRAVARSARRAGWVLNALVDAARGRYDR